MAEIDSVTREWIRNEADERAAAAGCRFDLDLARHPITFAEKYLCLYEGEFAGQPLIALPWQEEVTMRLFGWVKWSQRWNRWVRRFRRASIWVPKKNGKSPTLAWWGLYLLCADGEKGQKVYLGAKDGEQAREIAGKHAVEMVQSSPVLMAQCKINRSLMQITHEPTKSILKPVSGNDSRSKKAKEGLNGSFLIDETHVVDADFITRIDRAGISRSEPLHIEVSTAGNDPHSYGKRQYDRGHAVNRGDIDDPSLLFVAYEAPQNLSDAELAADPIKYGKMANPSWGHTIAEEEFLDDYNRSKLSPTELANFKMYRLNVWQESSNPWLRRSDWDACAASFTLDRFKGQRCWLGLDKSKTRDMTALVAIFHGEEPGTFYQYPQFWLPRATAEANRQHAPFLEWADRGHLNLIDGEVIEDQWIEQAVEQIHDICHIQAIYYDRKFASDFTLLLQQKYGIERVDVDQSAASMTAPIEDYERLVITHALKHNNNPVLNWQAGHCRVRNYPNGCKLLVKPGTEDVKKIDGMVAGVLALSGAISAPHTPINRGRLFLVART